MYVPVPRFTVSKLAPIWLAAEPTLTAFPIPSCPILGNADPALCHYQWQRYYASYLNIEGTEVTEMKHINHYDGEKVYIIPLHSSIFRATN